ncbi:hypothetical protein [Clostridium tagluense]|uniref:hypothetical protein n=1 Tax=Clostridium tagluense TaxID=360422 RepID=UPI001CF2C0DA|nr:hypothetical protein [Clostridium tagluense]MCB2300405.1 hypothetical protein [Clostridium tagluense]
MPLHQIPLCNLKYVGVKPSSSGTFEYDTRAQINKTAQKLFYKNNVIEIDKIDSKMICKEVDNINKNTEKSLCNELPGITKNKDNFLHEELFSIAKNKEFQSLNLKINEFTKNNILSLSAGKNLELTKNKEYQFAKCDLKFTKNSTFQFSKNNLDFIKAKEFILDKAEKYKEVSIENRVIELIRAAALGMDKFIPYNLLRDLNKLDYNVSSKLLNKSIVSQLYLKENNMYLDRYNIKNMDKYVGNLLMYTRQVKQIYKGNALFVNRVNEKLIDKNNIIFRQVYKDYKNIFKNDASRLMYKDAIKNIFIDEQYLLYRNSTKGMLKDNKNKLMYKDASRGMLKNIENYLDKIDIKNIYKDETLSLKKDVARDIFKGKIIGLNKTYIEISNTIDYGLNKVSDTNIYVPYELKGLNKFATDIYIAYTSKFIEVIKRWWVLEATAPTDFKILPDDYGYVNNPLSVNRRDREYRNMTDLLNHPISFMPYLENDKGIDLDYGTEEMSLSIEILLEMVNIVGMIVMRSASQFANASGQEAIEFIMELLLDWFNMDSTIREMNLKGSREHYLRSYRWIRWEAEKVWFKADKDHTQDRMMGIKYAGMLFSNLLDYMKYHHFNLVPIWRNLKCMDTERNFNRKASNGDLMKNLDKLKGRRHYFIETKNKI